MQLLLALLLALAVGCVAGEPTDDLNQSAKEYLKQTWQDDNGFFHPVSQNVSSKLLSNFPTASWMGSMMDSIGNLTLFNITLPGTHDSGAYILTSDVSPSAVKKVFQTMIEVAEKLGIPIQNVITPWALAQEVDLYQQLNGGIRYIDFRTTWDATTSKWRTLHFEMGVSCEIMLGDIQRFLQEQPSEILVIETDQAYDPAANPTAAQKKDFIDMIILHLGDHLIPSNTDLSQTSIASLVASDKRVIFTADDNDFFQNEPRIWAGDVIINSYANSDDLNTMINYNNQQIASYQANNDFHHFYKLSWTLTTQPSSVLKSIFPWNPHSLQDNAIKANKALPDWLKQQGTQRIGTIFIIDFFDESEMAPSIINLNRALSYN